MNTRNHDEETGKIRTRRHGIRRMRGSNQDLEGDHHGSSPLEMPRRRLSPTNHTTENAMRRSHQRQGETRHEDDGRAGAIVAKYKSTS